MFIFPQKKYWQNQNLEPVDLTWNDPSAYLYVILE